MRRNTRHTAEEEISSINERRLEEDRFRASLEAAPTGMLLVNHLGIIELVNTKIEDTFGYSRKELVGKSIEILVPETIRARHPQLRNDFFTNPEVRPMGGGRDLHGQHKDGRRIPVEIGLNPLKMKNETFVIASVIDISERKEMKRITTFSQS